MIKITLDPGHGQYANRSPLDGNFYEGTNNYQMALALKDALLTYEGVDVVLTRNNITEDPNLDARGKLAASNDSDLFFSIHSNAYSDPSAYGVTGFYSVKTPDVKPLCGALCHTTASIIPGSKVRRVITKTLSNGEDYYGVLRASKGVRYSMLIEHGFHTNANELSYISKEDWKDIWASSSAKIIADFFGLEKPAEEEPEIPDVEDVNLAEELESISTELERIGASLTKITARANALNERISK